MRDLFPLVKSLAVLLVVALDCSDATFGHLSLTVGPSSPFLSRWFYSVIRSYIVLSELCQDFRLGNKLTTTDHSHFRISNSSLRTTSNMRQASSMCAPRYQSCRRGPTRSSCLVSAQSPFLVSARSHYSERQAANPQLQVCCSKSCHNKAEPTTFTSVPVA